MTGEQQPKQLRRPATSGNQIAMATAAVPIVIVVPWCCLLLHTLCGQPTNLKYHFPQSESDWGRFVLKICWRGLNVRFVWCGSFRASPSVNPSFQKKLSTGGPPPHGRTKHCAWRVVLFCLALYLPSLLSFCFPIRLIVTEKAYQKRSVNFWGRRKLPKKI